VCLDGVGAIGVLGEVGGRMLRVSFVGVVEDVYIKVIDGKELL